MTVWSPGGRIFSGKVCAWCWCVARFVNSMKLLPRILLWAWLALLPASLALSQQVILNEIMYHPLQPPFAAEPVGEEFIELFNRGTTNVNLSGWHFSKGIHYTFGNVTLAP